MNLRSATFVGILERADDSTLLLALTGQGVTAARSAAAPAVTASQVTAGTATLMQFTFS